MMKLFKVEGSSHLYRDANTGALINKDDNAYHQYINTSTNRMNTRKEINKLKSDMSEIKSLLMDLNKKINK